MISKHGLSLLLCAAVCLVLVPATAQGQRGRSSGPITFEGVEVGKFPIEVSAFYSDDDGLPSDDIRDIALAGDIVYAATGNGVARYENGSWASVSQDEWPEQDALGSAQKAKLRTLIGADDDTRQIANASDGRVAVAALAGLFLSTKNGEWQQLYPRTEDRSWAPHDVRGVAFDSQGRLWFASPQGAGCLDGETWTLYKGSDGLPYNDFTTLAAGEDGVVWFGTKIGAIRYDGEHWAYRQGRRWLPDDDVRAITVTESGDAWIATAGGVGLIERRTTTLAEKADFFGDEIDRYNRRTPYGYVLEAYLENPGDKSKWRNTDSDNDGLWTAMYGAAECYRYAATKDPVAKERATKAFEALAFLSEVTQGGTHPAPPGFPARSILPTSGHDPNESANAERDRERRATRDPRWKILEPRWPVNEDGKWYWKTDTSSDELDGHYYFYSVYYDLVAETEAEKARVRDVTLAITDHMIDNGFTLIDHDGRPTRWAIFGPEVVNRDLGFGERGLNSLSMLSFLKVADHMSDDPKYANTYKMLIEEHGYAMNTLHPKFATGPGTGNQSDDEMAFMNYYCLFAYEEDPELLEGYMRSLLGYWMLEEPELCPLFNYMFAACLEGKTSRWGRFMRQSDFMDEALDTLKRYPLDRIEWEIKNSHRTDIVTISSGFGGGGKGHRPDGRVLPIDERNVGHWNHDPWRLDYGGDGKRLNDGASFLLPYYMGLYYGYIIEK
jgi:hypothetical protein